MSKKNENQSEETAPAHPTEDYEKAVVDAQWAQAKSLGLLDVHGESINENRPKE